jgi:hypothetical protein
MRAGQAQISRLSATMSEAEVVFSSPRNRARVTVRQADGW